MPDEIGEELEPTTEVAEPKVEESPTAAEQLAKLQTERDEVLARAEKAEKRSQGLEGSLHEKDKQLRALADAETRFKSINDRIEILATAIATGRSEDDVTPDTVKDVTAKLSQMKAEEEARIKTAKQQQETESYNSQANAVYSKAEELYAEDVDKLFQVRQYLRSGDMDLAQKMVAKAEKKVEPKVESEEELKKKWIDEGKRLALEEKGGLNASTTQPSGSVGNDEKWLEEQYSTGRDLDHKRAQKVLAKLK